MPTVGSPTHGGHVVQSSDIPHRRSSRSGSVVYPEDADQGKPKLFARQSILVNGAEDEEMADVILEARRLAGIVRRSSVAPEDQAAHIRHRSSVSQDRRISVALERSIEEEKVDAAQADGDDTRPPMDERRRSSVITKLPPRLLALMQQSDEHGVQQKSEEPVGVSTKQMRKQDEPKSTSPVSGPSQTPQSTGWCSSLLSCFKPSDEEEKKDTKGDVATTGASTRVPPNQQYEPEPELLALLAPQAKMFAGRKLLVLDLDETLVHSSFKPVPRSDYILDITVDSTNYKVFVLKRPGVDDFLRRMAEIYEVIIFTASLPQYANPLLDKLDPNGYITARLYREHCVFHEGYFVKDLVQLRNNEDLQDTIIVDNSPMAYMFQPDNAIDCTSWLEDPNDRELDVMADFLEVITGVQDVRDYVEYWREGAAVMSPQAGSV